MKMLTLNAHSLHEPNYEEKLDYFLEFVFREQPDLIALQEVNQSVDAAPAHDACGMIRIPGTHIALREDNHALRIARRLKAEKAAASWAYLPIKLGYGKYDEGVAILSLNGRIASVDACAISRTDDYQNWRTRKALGVRIESRPEWFYSVHMGWWQDWQDPFRDQWALLNGHLHKKCRDCRIWLLGDFNSPAEVRGQGYDLIAAGRWHDAWILAGEREGGCTVAGPIDGWRETPGKAQGMRIDHIWCSERVPVKSCRVVFNGKYEPVVSDHFGVLVETN